MSGLKSKQSLPNIFTYLQYCEFWGFKMIYVKYREQNQLTFVKIEEDT